jgi:3',5'-cyclic-AMP phosphodiesterase
MPKLAWQTDLHLNFASTDARWRLIDEIDSLLPDHLLLGADIAEAPTLAESLEWLASETGRPLWFVLGDRDYYHGSIREVREPMRYITETSARIQWLPARGIVPLTDDVCPIDHGGWGDARVLEV